MEVISYQYASKVLGPYATESIILPVENLAVAIPDEIWERLGNFERECIFNLELTDQRVSLNYAKTLKDIYQKGFHHNIGMIRFGGYWLK